MGLLIVTNRLRWELRRVGSGLAATTVHVLQQAWQDQETGAIAWRDVPTVAAAPDGKGSEW